MKRSVYITTLGCRANQADSEALLLRFLREGFVSTSTISQASVCVVNTCTVTSAADQQSRQLIRRIRRENSSAKIIVTGCYANMNEEGIRDMPESDFIWPVRSESMDGDYDQLENQFQDFLKEVYEEWKEQELLQSTWALSDCRGANDFDLDLIHTPEIVQQTRGRVRPFVRIQNGCNLACTYCIVPKARGRSRSLTIDAVMSMVFSLSNQGYHEGVLTGIHLGHFGWDLRPKVTLLDLLRHIEEKKPIKRVRLSSIDPNEVTDDLIDFVSDSEYICHHFHIPYQSGSEKILKLMKRAYCPQEFEELAHKIRKKIPDCSIGTDIIAGFPGEQEAEFEETFTQIERLPLNYLHVFPYSERTGTRASQLTDKIGGQLKKKRVRRLIDLSNQMRTRYYHSQLNRQLDIIIESRRDSETRMLKGISRNYVPVLVEGGDELYGKLLTVKILDAGHSAVKGEIDKICQH